MQKVFSRAACVAVGALIAGVIGCGGSDPGESIKIDSELPAREQVRQTIAAYNKALEHKQYERACSVLSGDTVEHLKGGLSKSKKTKELADKDCPDIYKSIFGTVDKANATDPILAANNDVKPQKIKVKGSSATALIKGNINVARLFGRSNATKLLKKLRLSKQEARKGLQPLLYLQSLRQEDSVWKIVDLRNHYPGVADAAYLVACMKQADANVNRRKLLGLCGCILNYLQQKLTYSELEKLTLSKTKRELTRITETGAAKCTGSL